MSDYNNYDIATHAIIQYNKGDIDNDEFESIVLPILKKWNTAYRAGSDLVSDPDYDAVWYAFRDAFPNHSFITNIEPIDSWRQIVVHDVPMLSIDKDIGSKGTNAWLRRVARAEKLTGINATIRVTAKLDGNACKRTGNILATRGKDGSKGYNVSHLFTQGVIHDKKQGLGEIVITKKYFDNHLKKEANDKNQLTGRNVTTSLCNARSPRIEFLTAIKGGAVHFRRYATLPYWNGKPEDYQKNQEYISNRLQSRSIYPTDGVVAEVLEPEIRAELGAGNAFNGWNYARKDVGETALATVLDIKWQVGRTGVVTPVLKITPAAVSGCIITSITAHNASRVINNRSGIGSEIEVVRSGLVIPAVHKVTKPVDVRHPDVCPCCNNTLEYDGISLICDDSSCTAQMGRTIYHFVQTIGSKNLGETIAYNLADAKMNIQSLIVATQSDLIDAGVSDGVAKNIIAELERVKSEPIEDWKVLASFGFKHLGCGDSKSLLATIDIDKISSMSYHDITAIKGFKDKKGASISNSFGRHAGLMKFVMDQFQNITNASKPKLGSLAGKYFVFTGVLSMPRTDIQNIAMNAGAKVQSKISAKTDYLVAGDKVGATKIRDAENKGIEMISEADFDCMLHPSMNADIDTQLKEDMMTMNP